MTRLFYLIPLLWSISAFAWDKHEYEKGDCVVMIVKGETNGGYTGRVMEPPRCTVTDLKLVIDVVKKYTYIAHFAKEPTVIYEFPFHHVDESYVQVNCDGRYP